MTEQTSAMSVHPLERAVAVSLAVFPEHFASVAEIIAPADIEDIASRAVFEALVKVEDFRKPPGDLASLVLWLDAQRGPCCPSAGGWLQWINEESQKITSAAKVTHWAHTIARASLARKLDHLLTALRCDVQTASPTDHDGHEQLLDGALKEIMALIDSARRREALQTMHEATQAIVNAPKTAQWLSTGLREIDNVTHGLHRDDVFVIGARTSQGKSTLALQVAMNAARDGGKTLICSLEMGSDQLSRRVLSNLSGLPLFNLNRELDADERQGLEIAQVEVATWPISIMPSSSDTSPSKIRATARALAKNGGLDVLVVDYIQLLSEPSLAKQGRAAEVSAISHAFKALAAELHCVVIVVAQLNRDLDRGGDGLPKLHHLRESGAIEHDADVVILLHTTDEEPGVMFCNIAKNRHGECRQVRVQWTRPTYNVRDLAFQGEAIYP